MKKITSILLASALLATALTGCGGSESEQATESDSPKIAMVAGGVFGDQGMNDAMLNGMKMFTEETGIEVTSVEVSETSDHAINASNFGQQGFDVVIMGGPVSEIIPDIATQYPDTHYILNKGSVDGIENVTSLQTIEVDGCYLAGAFAALMSQSIDGTNKVGWVGGARIPDLEAGRFAFSAGVESMGGECDFVYVGNFTDIAKGQEIALQMYSDGCKIVQGFAGGASNGVYQAAETMSDDHYAMGSATGQFHLSPDKIIASSVVNYDIVFRDLLLEYVDGTLESGIVIKDISSSGTGIKYSPTIGDQIPADILETMAQLEQDVIDDVITIPTTEEEYLAFQETLA